MTCVLSFVYFNHNIKQFHGSEGKNKAISHALFIGASISARNNLNRKLVLVVNSCFLQCSYNIFVNVAQEKIKPNELDQKWSLSMIKSKL